jgi:hypothetical protein
MSNEKELDKIITEINLISKELENDKNLNWHVIGMLAHKLILAGESLRQIAGTKSIQQKNKRKK